MKLHSSGLFCVCCMLAHAADGCACDTHDFEPLSDIPTHLDIAMGLTGEEHHEECPNREYYHKDCDCEHISFSSSKCEGCGTYLAGERYAFSLFYRDDMEAEIFEIAEQLDFDTWSAGLHGTPTPSEYAGFARRALMVSRRFREHGNIAYARKWAVVAHRWVNRLRPVAPR